MILERLSLKLRGPACVKRKTAKMKLLPSVFNSLNSRVKIFVLVENSRRHFSICIRFNEGLEEKNTNSEVVFAVCRLPFDIRPRNVKLNLSILPFINLELCISFTCPTSFIFHVLFVSDTNMVTCRMHDTIRL